MFLVLGSVGVVCVGELCQLLQSAFGKSVGGQKVIGVSGVPALEADARARSQALGGELTKLSC